MERRAALIGTGRVRLPAETIERDPEVSVVVGDESSVCEGPETGRWTSAGATVSGPTPAGSAEPNFMSGAGCSDGSVELSAANAESDVRSPQEKTEIWRVRIRQSYFRACGKCDQNKDTLGEWRMVRLLKVLGNYAKIRSSGFADSNFRCCDAHDRPRTSRALVPPLLT